MGYTESFISKSRNSRMHFPIFWKWIARETSDEGNELGCNSMRVFPVTNHYYFSSGFATSFHPINVTIFIIDFYRCQLDKSIPHKVQTVCSGTAYGKTGTEFLLLTTTTWYSDQLRRVYEGKIWCHYGFPLPNQNLCRKDPFYCYPLILFLFQSCEK